jgi:hypothetical protein
MIETLDEHGRARGVLHPPGLPDETGRGGTRQVGMVDPDGARGRRDGSTSR